MPSVSEAQHSAMEAAAHGCSTLGIPESVGKEFVAADESLDESIAGARRRLALRAITSSFEQIGQRLRGLELTNEVARFDAEWDARADGVGAYADDANWTESDHPRASDGKFTSGAGVGGAKHSPEVKAAFNEYMANVKPGTKPKPAGLMKHMLMKGGFTANEIFQSAKQAFNLDDKAAIYPNIYHSQMTKAGLNPPEIQGKWGKPKTEKAEEAKIEEIAAPPAQAPVEVKKSEAVGAPVLDTKAWVKTSDKLGSNPGGKYKDAEGKEWYGKQSKSPDHAKNEVLASKLYELAGAPVVKSQLADFAGQLGTAAPWMKATTVNALHPNVQAEAAQNFAVHAWLANWDAAGLTHDNQADIDGKLTTMDVGGALLYRAQGQPKGKAFGDVATEWETLRNSEINQQNAELFGSMTEDQLKDSAKKVAAVSDKAIWELVQDFGPGDADDKMALASKLMARRDSIVEQAGLNAAPVPVAATSVVKTPMQVLSPETHNKFDKFINEKYLADNQEDKEKAHAAQDAVSDILGQISLEEAYANVGNFSSQITNTPSINAAFGDYTYSVYMDLGRALEEAKGQNTEFEQSHDRNPDGTFKKKFGAEENPVTTMKAGESLISPKKVTPAPNVLANTVKVAQKFEDFGSTDMKKAAQELLQAKSSCNIFINENMTKLQTALEGGVDGVIETLNSLDIGTMPNDLGVNAYNSFIDTYKKELAKFVTPPPTKVPEPAKASEPTAKHNGKVPKEVLSKQSMSSYDTLLSAMLSAPSSDNENVKKTDDFVSEITDMALDGKWEELHAKLGPMSSVHVISDQDSGLLPPLAEYMYQVWKDAGQKIGNDNYGQEFPSTSEPAKPDPALEPVPKKYKISKPTSDFHDQLKTFWPQTLPANLEVVQSKDAEIEEALSKPTAGEQKAAVEAIAPIDNPSGQAKKGLNTYLDKVKKDYGVSTDGAGKTSTEVLSPAQEAAAKKIKTFPAQTLNHTYVLEDHEGKEVTATLKASSKSVPEDYYSKVTAAYGGNHDEGVTGPVDKAMEKYFHHMWEAFDGDEKNSLAAYKNGAYTSINNALLGKMTPNEHIKEHIAKMSQAIQKSVVPATTPAFRGLSCTMKELTGFDDPEQAVGRCFEHKNFASVSRNHGTSTNFGARTMMKMTLPAGTPGVLLNGQDPGEREIILDRRSMFRIDKVEKTSHYNDSVMLHVTYIGRRDDDGEGE